MISNNSSFPALDQLLAQPNITIEDVLDCPDMYSAYMKNYKDLILFLTTKQNFTSLINLLHTTESPKRTRKIIDLFSSPNKTLIRCLSHDRKTTELLISVFKSDEEPHFSIITAIMQICVYAFNDSEREMFAIFNSSHSIFPDLLKHIQHLSVFSFLRSILKSTVHSQTFLWYFFVALMDEHGVGTETPEFIQAEFAMRTPDIHLSPDQRKSVIDLLAFYFQLGGATAHEEFVAAVTQGLPLILQDANSDPERASVLKLGLFLPCNPTICLSCVSILECFRLPCELLQVAMRYLTQNQYKISPDLAELLLFRMIRVGSSNILVRESLPLFREFSHSQVMQNTLLGILNFSYDKSDWKNNIGSRTIRCMLTQAICGQIVDPMDQDYQESLKKIIDDPPEGIIDQSRLKMLRLRTSQPMPARYNAVILWGDEAAKMAEIYPNINKPNYLRLLNPHKFEEVHFVSEPKLETPSTEKVSKQESPINSGQFSSLHGIDEFDTGEPEENPFLVPPPPQSIQMLKKPSAILRTMMAPRATLSCSDSLAIEVLEVEIHNRKTQTKTRSKQDAMVSTTTDESCFYQHVKPQFSTPPKSEIPKFSLKADVNQIEAPPLELPVNSFQPAGLMVAPQKGNTSRRISAELTQNDLNSLKQPILHPSNSGSIVPIKPAPVIIPKSYTLTPNTSSSHIIIHTSSSTGSSPATSPLNSNELTDKSQSSSKLTQNISNPLVDIVLQILKQPPPPIPSYVLNDLNLNWIKAEIADARGGTE
ncbi:hypothetical protein TVAG_274850 [Trichomonas vaginalis G3]|uniref:Uncharacterized protein n=1 Tax=Trichomonas vaginalis (strain ATCC PRA-98 / G3) TaxID=412133 RepID=A2EB75_TRIV3|nr:serine/threonine-protein phosphatase 6 regulatory subunit family [Trichomonas vaginalis G3]EAY10121.1 hypothetical protein TVAG_274850 [Trichomonas vaginalis G3]KAI5531505.1 serine/threonine-protein phosphatase 6 regulatory subunit family [Trichomonas vaginalis G3]|eukprot:XP_001322344.1 hypothetical protein [Trichomonas vaginalis G3]